MASSQGLALFGRQLGATNPGEGQRVFHTKTPPFAKTAALTVFKEAKA
jgi:hypothetical protein